MEKKQLIIDDECIHEKKFRHMNNNGTQMITHNNRTYIHIYIYITINLES